MAQVLARADALMIIMSAWVKIHILEAERFFFHLDAYLQVLKGPPVLELYQRISLGWIQWIQAFLPLS